MWFEFIKVKGAKIILYVKSPTLRAAKLKGFTVISFRRGFGYVIFLLGKTQKKHQGDLPSTVPDLPPPPPARRVSKVVEPEAELSSLFVTVISNHNAFMTLHSYKSTS